MGGGDSPTTSIVAPMAAGFRLQSTVAGMTLPILYGTQRITGNFIDYDDFTAVAHTSSSGGGGGGGKGGGGGGGGVTQTDYTYTVSFILGLCEGPLGGIVDSQVWKGKDKIVGSGVGMGRVSALATAGLTLFSGAANQQTWAYWASKHPDKAFPYRNIAYLCAANFDLGNNDTLDQISVEAVGVISAKNGGAHPADIIVDILTHASRGIGLAPALIGDLTAYRNYVFGVGAYLSPWYNNQAAAGERITRLLALTNSNCFFSEGILKIVPYGDTAVGNYTPPATPVFDLTDEDFLDAFEGDPVKITRKNNADRYNQVQIEFLNKANEYNPEISSAQDQAEIDTYGLRAADVEQCHEITDPDVARAVAQIKLQRSLYIPNVYAFKLGWKASLLEPMDIVTLTDAALGLAAYAVRITAIEEGEDGEYSITAEDYPAGVSSHAVYPSHSGDGYSKDNNVAPGNVAAPVFFEPPVELAPSGLEVWMAVTGLTKDWGSCNVHMSLDNLNYKFIGRCNGGARYGDTTSALAASGNQVGVQMRGRGGQLLSATAADAAQHATLTWIGAAGDSEFIDYTQAALTGVNAYTLTVQRGDFSTHVKARSAGAQWARVDGAMVKTGPLDWSMIGKTLYFKFTSLNIYGAAEQSVADVSAYAYTVTGEMLKLPPPDVAGLTLSITNTGLLAKWERPDIPDWDRTEISFSPTFSSFIDTRKTLSHELQWQTAGLVTLYARHWDSFGACSVMAASTAITIRPPAAPVMTATEMQGNALTMLWNDSKTDQPILRYQYFMGPASPTVTPLENCPPWGSAGSDGRSDLRFFRTPGLKVVYVVAYDVAGNASAPTSFIVTSVMPVDFVLATEYYEDWQTAEAVNCEILGGAGGQLMLPVAAGETWAQHWTNNGWISGQDKADSAYPLWYQPATATGSHTEQHDCGRVIGGGVISVSPTAATWGSGVTAKIEIRVSLGDTNASWSDWTETAALQAANFRYLEVRYSAASNGNGVMVVDDLYVDVRLQQLTETAVLNLVATDVLGTFYPTTKPFIDIQGVQATPLASPQIARSPNCVIKDDAQPFGVYVQGHDANNNRVNGTVSLTITGV